MPDTGVCETKAAGPYKFIGLGAINVTKPYRFIWFGDIHGPDPYEFLGLGGFYFANTGIGQFPAPALLELDDTSVLPPPRTRVYSATRKKALS